MPDILTGRIELHRMGGPTSPPNPQQTGVLRRSLELLPIEHLSLISRIEARAPGQVPLRGGGNDPASGIVRLSSVSFSSPENAEVNLTLLHEIGHVVDHRFGCTRQIEQMARDAGHPFKTDAEALLATPHIGRTQWAGEKIADCYMVLFRSLVVSRPYISRSCPTQYQGAEAQRRFRVLLNTTAFRSISMQQLIDNSDPASFNRMIGTLI